MQNKWHLTFLERFSQKHSTSEVIWVEIGFCSYLWNTLVDFEFFFTYSENYKSLYGLKQSGRNWNKMLHEYLRSMWKGEKQIWFIVQQTDVMTKPAPKFKLIKFAKFMFGE